jgi:DNA-binding XRE family transcriptional regulator
MRTNLKVYRCAKRLSQQALANAIGVDVSFISKLENGIRGPHLLVALQLAACLDCSVGQLWQLSDNELPGLGAEQLRAIA